MAAWQEAVTVQPRGSASKLWPCREAARGGEVGSRHQHVQGEENKDLEEGVSL